MTIARTLHESIPGLAHVLEQRPFNIEIDGWKYRGYWKRSWKEVNGVAENMSSGVIDLRISNDETAYKMYVYVRDKTLSADTHFTEKRASNGSWRKHSSKQIDDLFLKFQQHWNSRDFQAGFLERTEQEAYDEIQQLKERIQLLEDYALNLKRQREELLDK